MSSCPTPRSDHPVPPINAPGRYPKNPRIGLRLGLAFAALIAILVGIGDVGVRRMDQIQAELNQNLGRRWVQLELSHEALALSNRNSRLMMEAFLVKDDRVRDSLLKSREEISAEITEFLAALDGGCGSEEERRLLADVTQARARYVNDYYRALHVLVEDKNREAAESLMVGETANAMQDYQLTWDAFIEFQKLQLNHAWQQARSRYALLRRVAWLLIALGTIVALAIALFTTRSTAREIRARILAQNEATGLNAELEQRVARRTAELTETNARLAAEIEVRKRAEEQYREEAAARLLVQAELARNEQRMNFALQAADIGTWDWDILTGEQAWSEQAKKLLGMPMDVPTNFESLLAAMHPDFRDKMWPAVNQAIDEIKDFVFEFSSVWPDGSLHWQVSKGRAFYDATGRATRMAGVVINIDRRKATEDRLRLQATALQAAANAIVLTDPQGTIVRVNPAFTTMTGYSLSDALGKNPRILSSGKHDRAFYRNLWATISSGKVWHGEIINRRKDGTLYNEEMTITPVISDRGKITNYVAIKQEVTSRKRMEEQLRQAQKMEAIGQLAAGIAHEINTPAQYVRDNTTFLKESWNSLAECISLLHQAEAGGDDILKQFAAACQRADLDYLKREIPQAIEQSLEGIERISKIVLAMKEFSHPGSAEKAAVDLNRAIETTITVARNEWRYLADMETQLDPQLPLVPCHVGEIKQVVLNLLTNAAYAIRQVVGDSGQKGKLTVRTAHAGDFVEISVTDTGAGIPEQIQSRIFEYFFTTKPVGSGTGQGLAMAHNSIVKRHGGKIWFETVSGKGTTFFIRLPLKTAEEADAKAAGQA